jgi:1-acyl-sn-glycerol-3-phosphate acyltransferase
MSLLRGMARRDRGVENWPFGSEGRRVVRRLRAVRRFLVVALWTVISIVVQAALVLLPGRPKVWFARLYWSTFCWLLGMHVRVIGVAANRRGQTRPVVFVSNHSSWLDVPVLGGRLSACFIAKEEVGRWPVVRTVARLGRTVMVSRSRITTARERDELRERIRDGDSLILFPEGTTSDGSRVLPFRSSFFAVAEGEASPLIQPVSVVYDRLAGLPTGRASRPLFAWYGDMDIASHFWRLAQHHGLRATILLHTPLDPCAFADRKALARAVWTAVADGAATLRQNRPARPLAAADSMPADGAEPALA